MDPIKKIELPNPEAVDQKVLDNSPINNLILAPDIKTDIKNDQETVKKVSKEQLINKLNHINFRDDTIRVNFKHKKYERMIFRSAKPLPCHSDLVECIWTEPIDVNQILGSFDFFNFSITDGRFLISVTSELNQINTNGIIVTIKEASCKRFDRKTKRYECSNLNVQFIQNSAIFFGSLIDFSTSAFKVAIEAVPPQTFQWIDPDRSVNIIIFNNQETLYSGECTILRHSYSQKTSTYILSPKNRQIQRYKPKEFRSTRIELIPSPSIFFTHPLTGKDFNLKVINISGPGFAVEESENNATLLPGLIIPELELNFASGIEFKCKVQVIYNQKMTDVNQSTSIKCGIAILDMDPENHLKLLSLLYNAENKNSYLCNKIGFDSLWDFFFETGFIYPKKYMSIHSNKENIKNLYERLYFQNLDISRHFTYQERGKILGHVSILHVYEKSWMIHHLASRSAVHKAGLAAVDQVGQFFNDSYHINAMNMNYIMLYFRPDNKVPNFLFGGVARSIKNKEACSTDIFAYVHYELTQKTINLSLPPSWELNSTNKEDLIELETFYTHHSNGLMLRALNLNPDTFTIDNISNKYHENGLAKERHLYTLKKNHVVAAVIMVNISDIGLNMSNLTNCIKIFVLEPELVDKDILEIAVFTLFTGHNQKDMPILIYPDSYMKTHSLPYEKLYTLWIMNTQYTDLYFKYMNRLLRFSKKSR